MKRVLFCIAASVLAFALLSCSTGGRSVTVGGSTVPIYEAAGEFSESYLSSVTASVTARAGETVQATFEYAPDAVMVTCYPPDGGEPVEVASSQSAFRIYFDVPDIEGDCGFNISYAIDGSLYNLTFRLNVTGQ